MECNGKAGLAGFGSLAAGRKWRLAAPKALPEENATRRLDTTRRIRIRRMTAGCILNRIQVSKMEILVKEALR